MTATKTRQRAGAGEEIRVGLDNGRGTGDYGNIRRVAMISLHTSPIATLGAKDAGGMNVYVRELSRQLGRQGVAVDIFTRRSDTTAPAIATPFENVRVIQIAAGPPTTVPKGDLFGFCGEFASEMALFALRDGVTYDVVHAHYWLSGWTALLLRRYWAAPVVQMFHTLAALKKEAARGAADGQESPLRIETERTLIAQVDRIVAANARERAEMIWWYGQRSARVQTIPCGIDLERFYPQDRAAARAELDLGTAPTLLFVGRIDPVKGIDFLIESYAHLRADWRGGEPPQLVIVGGELIDGELGPDLARVRDRAAEFGVADGLIFRGPQPHETLARYYAAADITVVPSRYESFGLVAVESMACGTPVVASRAGGLAYTVEEGRNGLLVSYGDVPALAAALNRALGDETLRRQMSMDAIAAAQGYSWADVASRLLVLYAEVSADRHATMSALPAVAAGD